MFFSRDVEEMPEERNKEKFNLYCKDLLLYLKNIKLKG